MNLQVLRTNYARTLNSIDRTSVEIAVLQQRVQAGEGTPMLHTMLTRKQQFLYNATYWLRTLEIHRDRSFKGEPLFINAIK